MQNTVVPCEGIVSGEKKKFLIPWTTFAMTMTRTMTTMRRRIMSRRMTWTTTTMMMRMTSRPMTTITMLTRTRVATTVPLSKETTTTALSSSPIIEKAFLTTVI